MIAESKDKATKGDREDKANIKIYLDSSGIDSNIGAAAVLYCNGRLKRRIRCQLGTNKTHTVPKGEGVGMILGLELIRPECNVSTVTIGANSQGAIAATNLM